MRVNRILLSSSLIVVALVLQVSVLARLHLPGAVPDLLLLTVLGLALVYGHVGGALVGFAAGLLADLAPPADHAAGRYALVLCVIGYLAGLVKPETGQVKSAASAKRVAMPFGAGPRLCPGRYLAMLEIKMVIAMLFAGFDIERVSTPDGRDAEERLALTMAPVGLRAVLRPRG